MAKLRTITDLNKTLWSGSELIDTLSSAEDGTGVFLFAYSPELRSLLSWSANAPEILGVEDRSIARDGNLFLRHVHPDDRFILMSDLESALKGQSPYRATYRWIKPKTNELCWLHCRGRLRVRDSEEVFEGFIVDLTDEVTGAVSRFAGPDSVRSIINALESFVVLLDSDLRIIRINRSKDWRQFNFGDEQFRFEHFRAGKNLLECFQDIEQKEQLASLCQAALVEPFHSQNSRFTANNDVFRLTIAPLRNPGEEGNKEPEGLLLSVTEVTELVHLEKTLANLERTEGLRLVAAGVGHNVNNALQGILGHASVMLAHPNNESLVRESSQGILDIVKRISELTSQLYQNPETPNDLLLPVDLNFAVMAAINKLEDLFSGGTKIKVSLGGIGQVSCNQTELIEVLVSLLKNAKESQKDDRTTQSISVKTYQCTLEQYQVEDLPAGNYAKLTITDSGEGMSAHIQEKCREPFFTTKNVDERTGLGLQGQGLGLSAAFGKIRSFGGALVLKSTVGLGTTANLYLPLEASVTEEQPNRSNGKTRIGKTSPPQVLIVDDNAPVLRSLTHLITSLGFTTVSADNNNDALQHCHRFHRSLRVAMIDSHLNENGSARFIQEIRKRLPNIQIVILEADPNAARALRARGTFEGILQKPVGGDEIRRMLRSLLREEKNVLNR